MVSPWYSAKEFLLFVTDSDSGGDGGEIERRHFEQQKMIVSQVDLVE